MHVACAILRLPNDDLERRILELDFSRYYSPVNHHVSGYICAETPPPAGDDPTATGT
jgi:hypothetical protein